jgi:hypothetical protein
LDQELAAQEMEGLLLRSPEGFEAFVAFCRGYFCQDHAAFVMEACALEQEFHTLARPTELPSGGGLFPSWIAMSWWVRSLTWD